MEYAQLISDYRKLSAQPISFEGFHRMTEMALRLDEIRIKLQAHQPAQTAITERSLTL